MEINMTINYQTLYVMSLKKILTYMPVCVNEGAAL